VPDDAGDLGFARLVPLSDALGALEAACTEVAPMRVPLARARERVAAATVVAQTPMPDRDIALRDGWAVLARDTLGASSYAPNFATTRLCRVCAGESLPEATDAVLPLSFVDARTSPREIYGSVAPFEGARRRGGDLARGALLVESGEVIRPERVTLLELVGITAIEVRIPRVSVVSCGAAASPSAAYISAAAEREGATSSAATTLAGDPAALARVLAAQDADLVVVLGEASCGGTIATALHECGEILAHGIAARPGDTMGGGRVPHVSKRGTIPLVFAPQRFECAFTAWLLLARPCLARLAGRKPRVPGVRIPLTRKIVSAPGASDLVVLQRAVAPDGREMWEPRATGDIPWSALLAADGWLVVPPESEGFAAGQMVVAQNF
jgi:molybdopterin molybdotransferase